VAEREEFEPAIDGYVSTPTTIKHHPHLSIIPDLRRYAVGAICVAAAIWFKSWVCGFWFKYSAGG
jgi:hypothetical protein